jgi:dTMP kinase
MTKGKLITFEGIDGCGKTTQLKAVAEWLPTSGLLPEGAEVVTTREPGCIPGIRQLLKDPDTVITSRAELLLLMADRAQHVETVIKPELEKGSWVLCDRFYASTLAYQGWGRALGWQAVKQAHELASGLLYPDLELFFDVPADEALARLKRREGSEFAGDRFEVQGRPFVDRLVDGFDTSTKLPFLKEYPHTTIDGCSKPEEVTAECIQTISRLGRRRGSQL